MGLTAERRTGRADGIMKSGVVWERARRRRFEGQVGKRWEAPAWAGRGVAVFAVCCGYSRCVVVSIEFEGGVEREWMGGRRRKEEGGRSKHHWSLWKNGEMYVRRKEGGKGGKIDARRRPIASGIVMIWIWISRHWRWRWRWRNLAGGYLYACAGRLAGYADWGDQDGESD